MQNLENYIEHTLLKPEATQEDVKNTIDQAVKHNFFGVCINPSHIKYAKEQLKGTNVKIVTVIGFPLGANCSEVKAYEAQQAVKDGADELDMVINVGALKDKNYNLVQKDIEAVVANSGHTLVKVIIETDLLTKEEIKKASELCVAAKADFVKTSTGFVKGGVGAKVENVKLMYETVASAGLKVKASGGVKNKEQAIAVIEAGASRIGTSSGVAIVEGTDSKSDY